MRVLLRTLLICSAFSAFPLRADEHPPLLDPATLKATPDKGAVTPAAGHEGPGAHLSFPVQCKSMFISGRIHPDAAWDKAAGFSFWVKGDGSSHLAGLQLIWNEDYALRYDLAFPIDQTDWRKITVAWSDLIPVLPAPGSQPLSAAGGNAPSKLTQLWFGKWWYWRDDAAHQYTVSDFQLEPVIARDTTDDRPAGAPLARVAAKVKAGQPITIVTMGDSLTDRQHWTNRTTNWPLLLRQSLHDLLHCDATIVNPAIGGTQLRQNLVLLPSWLSSTPAPDLVTICFGYNDWDAGMRGPMFRAALVDAVERLRRATKGRSEILIMTTTPSLERWTTMAELSRACRDAAHDANAGLADTEAFFRKVSDVQRAGLYADDKTHLSKAGQEQVASAVLASIERQGSP